MSERLLAALALGCALVACDDALERMKTQPKLEPYEPSPFFEDGVGVRRLPQGAVARGAAIGATEVREGQRQGIYVRTIPLKLDLDDLERGRNRFDIYCATCHGVLGDGVSEVARRMQRRPPPSLVSPPISEYPAGRLYSVVTQGYGLMRAYSAELSETDRWCVVGYLQSLQLASRVALDSLPPPVRSNALTALTQPTNPTGEETRQ